MTHYTVKYSSKDKADNDAKAIRDVRDYLSPAHWAYFKETFFSVSPGTTISYSVAKKWLQALRFACVLVGVQGYPVRALSRKFLAQFRTK